MQMLRYIDQYGNAKVYANYKRKPYNPKNPIGHYALEEILDELKSRGFNAVLTKMPKASAS